MEQKKTRRADIEQRRTTGFLLGLIFVLSIFYVTLEWNSTDSNDDINPIDLDELMHESELVPMSNEELTTRIEEKQKTEKAEQLHVVDDQVELQPDDVDIAVEGEGDDDETLLQELQEEEDKSLAPLNVDPNNPECRPQQPAEFPYRRRPTQISRWCRRVHEVADAQPAVSCQCPQSQDSG